MRSRRHLIVPAALVGSVAIVSLVLFGGSARAQPPPTTTPSSTTSPVPGAGTTSTVNAPGSAGTPYGGSPTTVGTGINGPVSGQTGASSGQNLQQTLGGVPLPNTANRQNRRLTQGEQLFVQTCSSCHGSHAEGTVRAPTLTGLGAATVDFWVSTGRMPLENPTAQAQRKVPVFDRQQSLAIADYVASLSPGGPSIPVVDTNNADLQRGGSLFRLNCAACHSYLAVGGTLNYGAYAPPLSQATDTQIAEAIRTGPGNMPRFGPRNLTDQDVNDIVKYVRYIVNPDDRGGLSLSHVGPVPEGLVAFVLGVGLMMVAAWWIGDRA